MEDQAVNNRMKSTTAPTAESMYNTTWTTETETPYGLQNMPMVNWDLIPR